MTLALAAHVDDQRDRIVGTGIEALRAPSLRDRPGPAAELFLALGRRVG